MPRLATAGCLAVALLAAAAWPGDLPEDLKSRRGRRHS